MAWGLNAKRRAMNGIRVAPRAACGMLALGAAACSGGCERAPLPAAAEQHASAAPALVARRPAVRPAPAPERPALAPAAATADAPDAAVAPSDERLRIYARAFRTWIYSEPRASSERLGYVRGGGALLATSDRVGKAGCAGGWYAVEPRGFVCVGVTATLNPSDPAVVALRGGAPDLKRKLPFIYGMVRNSGPFYQGLPSRAELEISEPELWERMPAWLSLPGPTGAGYAQHVWLGGEGQAPDPAELWREQRTLDLPSFLQQNRWLPATDPKRAPDAIVAGQMRGRAGYSFLRTFVWQGRRYGLTPDLSLAPTDRFRPIQGSDFRGVEIGSEIELPFAFVRRMGARFWLYDAAARSWSDAGEASYRAAVQLTGKQKLFRGRLHYETREGKWLSDEYASRVDAAKRMPAWALRGERWLDINLSRQTLLAYDGTQPVFATLISSGEAGLEDPAHTTATKRGIFRIHTKHVSSTMSSTEAGEEFELRDVPYVQYFDEGYALHGAYWHDRFGMPRSHGCINLSPADARRLFAFTEPALPAGWHAVLLPLKGTVVFVHP